MVDDRDMRKSQLLRIRLHPDDKVEIATAAKMDHKRLSEWVRWVLVGTAKKRLHQQGSARAS